MQGCKCGLPNISTDPITLLRYWAKSCSYIHHSPESDRNHRHGSHAACTDTTWSMTTSALAFAQLYCSRRKELQRRGPRQRGQPQRSSAVRKSTPMLPSTYRTIGCGRLAVVTEFASVYFQLVH